MKTNYKFILILMLSFFASCIDDDIGIPEDETATDDEQISLTIPVSTLSAQQMEVQSYVKARPIIGHRGTTEYGPENTAATYQFARQVGADYIQIDLQMSSDNFLVGFRNDLDNHANISELFPGFENAGVNHYTLEELKSMDVGSSYNNSTYNRSGYIGLQILTLEEIINICEGKLPDGTPDPADNGNRPGLYIRFYQPWLNVGMEEVLKAELTRLGWYDDNLDNLRVIPTFPDKIGVANTRGRVFLGTLEKLSLLKLEEVFQGKIPLAFWLWKSSNYIKVDDAKTYSDFVNFGVNHGAQFISPNTSTNDLLKVWQSNLIRRTNARIQGFTISTKADLSQYTSNIQPESEGNIYQLEYNLTDGVITNRPQYATFYYGVNILPESDRIVPAPEFLDSGEIRDVFLNLGYQN